MTARPDAVREAFTLPILFLTVAAAGGFRVPAGGMGMQFVPPPLMAQLKPGGRMVLTCRYKTSAL